VGKNKQTENIRFSSQKYTQKPGFWLPRQILLVQMPAQIKTKAIDSAATKQLNSCLWDAIGQKSTASNNRLPAPPRCT